MILVSNMKTAFYIAVTVAVIVALIIREWRD
jgi:hypothetical protein